MNIGLMGPILIHWVFRISVIVNGETFIGILDTMDPRKLEMN